MTRRVVVIIGVAALLGVSLTSVLTGQAPQGELTEKDVTQLIKQSKNDTQRVVEVLKQRGVDFDVDPKIEKRLRKAGADDNLIREVWNAGPAARAARKMILTTSSGAQVQMSPEEGAAFQAIRNEPNSDRQLRLVSEFEEKYPQSQALSYVYAQAAKACQDNGNLDKAVVYGEKSLKLDPENIYSLLVVSSTLSQPSMLRGVDSERNARLAELENDANHALKLIEGMPQQPNETNEQLQRRKGELAADAHFSLGMVQLQHDDFAKAEEELNKAIASTERPTPQYYYRLGEAYANDGKTARAIEAFSKASELGKGTIMQKYADERVAELKKKGN